MGSHTLFCLNVKKGLCFLSNIGGGDLRICSGKILVMKAGYSDVWINLGLLAVGKVRGELVEGSEVDVAVRVWSRCRAEGLECNQHEGRHPGWQGMWQGHLVMALDQGGPDSGELCETFVGISIGLCPFDDDGFDFWR